MFHTILSVQSAAVTTLLANIDAAIATRSRLLKLFALVRNVVGGIVFLDGVAPDKK
jgi:hypothetical protein